MIVTARPWQAEAYKLLRGRRFTLIQAPGGSGKSGMQCMLGAAEIARDWRQRQLILVPQSHIHQGFFGDGDVEFVVGGDRLPWRVTTNVCCVEKKLRGRTLRQFLLDPSPGVAIATNHALISAWSRLTAAERATAVRRLTIRPDECHHLAGVFAEDDEGDDEGTRIGHIVRDVIRMDDPTAHVCLSTATFFRGDRRAILSDEIRDRFTQYNLMWDEYFPTLGIRDLRFDYVEYKSDPIPEMISRISGEPDRNHLVIIPPTERKYRTAETLDKLLAAVRRAAGENAVLDLVTPARQEANKKRLARYPDRYRVVVACRLFDEGTDWVPCNRLHNTDSGEQSQTLAVQRFFRPLRRHPGKRDVRIINYIPQFSERVGREQQREVLSDRLNCVLTAIMTNGELSPIMVPVGRREGGERKKRLAALYGDDYQDVLAALVEGYECLDDRDDPQAVRRMIGRVVDEFGVPDGADREGIEEALQVQLLRVATGQHTEYTADRLKLTGWDAAAIRQQGFDHVWELEDKRRSWGSDNIDSGLIRSLLAVLDNPLTLDEIMDGIRQHHARTGQRVNFYSGYIEELKITARALNNRLGRNHGLTIAQAAEKALGGKYDGYLERVRGVIREYGRRGVRLAVTTKGTIPELDGLTPAGVHNRLKRQFGTTLAAEVVRVLGPERQEFDLERVKHVLRLYARSGVKLTSKSGHIPELGVGGKQLGTIVREKYGTTLAGLHASA